MNTATLNGITLDGAPASGAKTVTYTTDAKLVYQFTKTYTTDAILQAKQSKTYTTDAVLQGGSSKFYSTDAVLVIPYHDQAHWGQMIGNNVVRPIDPNRVATWSTYSRPGSPIDGMTGRNVSTGKLETWNEKANKWQNADGTDA